MIESPNTNTAGIETFGGSFVTAFVLNKIKTKNIVKRRSIVQNEVEKELL
jgi:hypothetical protein